jgi:hypothetical protein
VLQDMTALPTRNHLHRADRVALGIARTTSAERAELLAFRARMYGPESAFADPAWVRWMYDEAPAAAVRGPALWTYRHEGRIEAEQGAIIARIRIGESERTLAWALDLMVSPAHRMRGVGSVLPAFALHDVDAAGGTEVSEAAQKSFARAGWSHHGTLPLWMLPVDPVRVLRARGAGLPARLVGIPARWAVSALRLGARARSAGMSLLPLAAFDERADAIWGRCSPEWPVIVRRDRAWLAWRWDACPRRDGAFGVWLMRGEEAVGWAMLRAGEHLGVPAGFILDFLCRPAELGGLVSLCVEELCRREVAAVYLLLRAPGADPVLRAQGFLRRDSGFAMMTLPTHLPPDERVALADPDLWFVTSGDSDLDRPRENTVYA